MTNPSLEVTNCGGTGSLALNPIMRVALQESWLRRHGHKGDMNNGSL